MQTISKHIVRNFLMNFTILIVVITMLFLLVDMTLDLHGMTQDNAYNALMQAMERAILQQLRILLVITGKGAPKSARDEADRRPRGILRKQVPTWLSDSRFAGHVFAIRPAHPIHGGAGAYYVLLRRPRS